MPESRSGQDTVLVVRWLPKGASKQELWPCKIDGRSAVHKPGNAVESRDEHMDIENMAADEFLDLLEQNAGRRWPKAWIQRLWNMDPRARWMLKAVRRSIRADLQKMAIKDLREYLATRALERLTR